MNDADFNWQRFYKALDGLVVQLPTYSDGEPIDSRTILETMGQIQRSRTTADRYSRTLLQKIGSLRRRLGIEKSKLRIEQALMVDDQSVQDWRTSARTLTARIQYLTSGQQSLVALIQGRLAEAEEALRAVQGILDTLTKAKETVNAIQRQCMAEWGGGRV